MNNPYDILGVNPNVTDDELKKAYRKLVQQYHPDTHSDKEFATQKMQEINQAYDKIREQRKNGGSSNYSNSSNRSNSSNSRSSNGSSNSSSNGDDGSSYSGSWSYTRTGNTRSQSYRWSGSRDNANSNVDYSTIRAKIKAGDLNDADQLLDKIPHEQRKAEWYFLKGQIAYYKGWLNDAQIYYNKAYDLEPDNAQYKDARDKLNNFSGKANSYKNKFNRMNCIEDAGYCLGGGIGVAYGCCSAVCCSCCDCFTDYDCDCCNCVACCIGLKCCGCI